MIRINADNHLTTLDALDEVDVKYAAISSAFRNTSTSTVPWVP